MVELEFEDYNDTIQVNEGHTGFPVGWIRENDERTEILFPAWNSADELLEKAEEDKRSPEVYEISYGETLDYDSFVEGVKGVEISGRELENHVDDISGYVEKFHKDPDIGSSAEQFVKESLEYADAIRG